eukprot:13547785-Ditylum_brightwellii.AAC.1
MGVSTSTTLHQLSDNKIYTYKDGVGNIDLTLQDNKNGDLLLNVATIFYLHMICESTLESKVLSIYGKAETVGKFLPDIPVLCDIGFSASTFLTAWNIKQDLAWHCFHL